MEELLSISGDSIEKFLFRWYGAPDLALRSVSAGAMGERMPTQLRDWFDLTSQWSADIVTSSSPLDPSELWVDDGKQIFWVDGQGSWEWGVALSGDDPSVFGREAGSDWIPAQRSLSEFLLHVTVLEAAIGALDQCYAHGVPEEQLFDVISNHTILPLPPLPCPSMDAKIYVGSETLLQVSMSMGDLSQTRFQLFDVSVASTAPGSIGGTIATYSSIPWKRHSEFIPQRFSPDDLPGFLR